LGNSQWLLRRLAIIFYFYVASWKKLRIPGVLQRFAIAYFFAFSIQLAFHKTPAKLEERYGNGKRFFIDELDLQRNLAGKGRCCFNQ